MQPERTVRRLLPEDVEALIVLRREALENHPFAFGASIANDRGLSLEFMRASLADEQEQAIFGHFTEKRLTGMVGLVRGAQGKQRHKAQIWGMYVAPETRAKGVGRALLEAAIAHARTWPETIQVHLCVSETATSAQRLYEALGFRSWGREPRALQWEGQFVDEFHLVLDLREAAGTQSNPTS